jgi:hypothetical protein
MSPEQINLAASIISFLAVLAPFFLKNRKHRTVFLKNESLVA